ncbi:MAG: glycosyltransferase [Bdellovibrionota bacterium]
MKPRILVLAKTMPLHDRASGDYRLSRILEILAGGGFEVDFLSTTHTAVHRESGKLEYLPRDSLFPPDKLELLDQRYIDDLSRLGVNTVNRAEPSPFTVRSAPRFDIRAALRKKAYDIVWVEFFYLAEEYIDDIRRFQPGARVICDSVDLHFRRLARQCNFMEGQVSYLVNSRHEKKSTRTRSHREHLADQRRHADHVRDCEIKAYQKCDAVVMVSQDDHDELIRHCPNLPVLLVPNIHKPADAAAAAKPTPFARRQGCVFVGNFDHNPNVSSCVFLKHEVAPLLEKESIRFQLVGSNPPKVVRTMGEHGPAAALFEVTGYVPEVLPYLESARVSVAPVLFGAGMNGKIGEALYAGLPVVTTALGALGMGLTHEETCLVADDPALFAAHIRRLHSDEVLWNRLRVAGLEHVDRLYSQHGVEKSLLAAVKSLLPPKKPTLPRTEEAAEVRLAPPAFPRAPARPRFSVILLTHNHWKFSELCLRSLAHAERANPGLAEYILVDNASRDETAAFARRLPNLKVIANEENLGFAGGNNVGIEAARGENIVLLNNDTIVPPNWLARFGQAVDAIPDLGLLGPATNTESGQRIPGVAYASIPELFALNETLKRGAWERVKKISGLCLVIPRPALEKIGLLDADFGIGYFEDDDLCLRAEDLGLTVAFAKDVFVHHFGSVTFSPQEKSRRKFLEAGMARFAFKWGKRGLDHITRQHQETLLRTRRPRSLSF